MARQSTAFFIEQGEEWALPDPAPPLGSVVTWEQILGEARRRNRELRENRALQIEAFCHDKEQLMPMVEVIEQQSGQRPAEILADTGYCSEKNLEGLESAGNPERRIEGYIATERQKHGEHRETCPRGPLPKDATRVDRMRRKLKTKAGKAVYAARKAIVEPVFGQIKQARGFRQFLLRGIEKVRGEWALVCLTHNILKCYRLCYE